MTDNPTTTNPHAKLPPHSTHPSRSLAASRNPTQASRPNSKSRCQYIVCGQLFSFRWLGHRRLARRGPGISLSFRKCDHSLPAATRTVEKTGKSVVLARGVLATIVVRTAGGERDRRPSVFPGRCGLIHANSSAGVLFFHKFVQSVVENGTISVHPAARYQLGASPGRTV